jgi:hypothetical protein
MTIASMPLSLNFYNASFILQLNRNVATDHANVLKNARAFNSLQQKMFFLIINNKITVT